jgi:hypothetical protein
LVEIKREARVLALWIPTPKGLGRWLGLELLDAPDYLLFADNSPFRGDEAARTQMLTRNQSPVDDCRSAHLRRYSLGAAPISRLKTRLKELSDPYPTADATSENVVLFERIMAPALCIRHCVRYSRGVWPKTVLNFKANADLDMRASRASDSTDQFLARPECIACIALLRRLSETAANHPFGGAAELLA